MIGISYLHLPYSTRCLSSYSPSLYFHSYYLLDRRNPLVDQVHKCSSSHLMFVGHHWTRIDNMCLQIVSNLLSIPTVSTIAVVSTVSASPYLSFLLLFYSFWVFHISFRWWAFSGVWVTASLLKSPGLFSVFRPFSIMLSFGWSPLGCQLPSPPVRLIILLLLYQKHQSQLV